MLKRFTSLVAVLCVAALALTTGALAQDPDDSNSGLSRDTGAVPLAASESIGGCTVRPSAPWISGGYAYAYMTISCSVGRTVIMNARIMEEDVGFDDEVGPLWTASPTIEAGRSVRYTISGRCQNFDLAGSEELYAKAKINVLGVNSSWARSYTVSTTC